MNILKLLIIIFLSFQSLSFTEDILIGNYDDSDYTETKNDKKEENKTEEVKPSLEIKNNQEIKKNETEIINNENIKKDEEIKKDKEEIKESKIKGFKEIEFDNFKMDIPNNCNIILYENKKSAKIGENKECNFTGEIKSFDVKYSTEVLVENYKTKCLKDSGKILYKRWLNNKKIEGHIGICKISKDINIIMESNDINDNISYQFIGKMKKDFNKKKKIEIFLMFNSLNKK